MQPGERAQLKPQAGARHSLSAQLNTMFVVLVTVMLLLSGLLNYARTRSQLLSGYEHDGQDLEARLRISLVTPVWNLDLGLVDQILDAELKPPVIGLAVYDENDHLLAHRGHLESSPDTDVDHIRFGLVSTQAEIQQTLGHVEAVLSREGVERELRLQMMWRLIEIIIFDFVLIAALWYSLRTKLIAPLSELRAALLQAAEHHGPAEALTLPADRRDELGDLARSFNRIAQRLADDAEAGRRAEAEIRSAYENLKLAQMSLVQAEKLAALGGLVAGIAHEINTPLGIALTSASLLGEETRQFAERVESGAVKKSDLQQYLRVTRESTGLILGNAERAASLVHSFKQVAVDQTSEARREFDLAQYIDEVIDSLRPKYKRTAIRVVNECPRDIRVDSYPGAVAQIITNLLLNALIHAFGEGQSGEFRITAQVSGRNVRLGFADNGCGINPEHLTRIFEPFFTTRRGAGGTGLGLHIVYNIVTKRLGGQIEVESEPGQGTRFALILPLQAPEPVEVSDD